MVKFTLKKVNFKNFKKNKRGVSEMVAYVILISIAMGLAVAIYAYLNYVVNIVKPPVECKEGTSISLEDYGCDPVLHEINLTIRNNGRFNVDGIIVKFSDNSSKEPIIMLKPQYSGTSGIFLAATTGHFSFDSLSPGEDNNIRIAKFTIIQDDGSLYPIKEGTLKTVNILPFIRDKKKVACTGTAIKQPLIDCSVA